MNKEQAMEKQLGLEFVVMCQRKAEMIEREKYEQKLKEREERRKQRKEEIKTNIVCYLILMIGFVLFFLIIGKCEIDLDSQTQNETYTTEIQTEPERVYPTERICKVVKVNKVENIITVEHDGQQYHFDGDGFLVGETIVCKFINTEIVDAER